MLALRSSRCSRSGARDARARNVRQSGRASSRSSVRRAPEVAVAELLARSWPIGHAARGPERDPFVWERRRRAPRRATAPDGPGIAQLADPR